MQDALSPLYESLPSAVEVHAHARLHLGFFDLHGGLGRRFGSLGVALDSPSTSVFAQPAGEVSAIGPSAERALRFARRALDYLGLREGGSRQGVVIEVCHALPEHAGLGSGTQLALAVGSAIARLRGLRWSGQGIAQVLDRGRRSGIGIGAFELGGFLVDGGHGDAAPTPSCVVSRLEFPKDWRWVLVFDDRHQGLSGPDEQLAFARLPRFAEEQAARLCRVVLMQLLPALAESDIAAFGQAVTTLQECVGDHFAPAQGGRYASRQVAHALQAMQAAGAAAIGQTSWGPTGFALAADQFQARALVDAARAAQPEPGVRFQICAARNRGADISATGARNAPLSLTHSANPSPDVCSAQRTVSAQCLEPSRAPMSV